MIIDVIPRLRAMGLFEKLVYDCALCGTELESIKGPDSKPALKHLDMVNGKPIDCPFAGKSYYAPRLGVRQIDEKVI